MNAPQPYGGQHPLDGSQGPQQQRPESEADPRFPSPRTLRRVFAFLIDMAISVGGGYAVVRWFLVHKPGSLAGLYGLVALVVISIVHRVLVQRIFAATLGKAITDLRIVRKSDAGRPTLWQLAVEWLRGTGLGIVAMAEISGSSTGIDKDPRTLIAVRRHDLRRLESSRRRW